MREMLESADLLLPNSVAELEMLVQHFGLPSLRGKATIVPNAARKFAVPADQSPFTDLPSNYVMEAAGFSHHKAQRPLIEALSDLPEIPLVLVGPGKGIALRAILRCRG
jgi:hypothetical protein